MIEAIKGIKTMSKIAAEFEMHPVADHNRVDIMISCNFRFSSLGRSNSAKGQNAKLGE